MKLRRLLGYMGYPTPGWRDEEKALAAPEPPRHECRCLIPYEYPKGYGPGRDRMGNGVCQRCGGKIQRA